MRTTRTLIISLLTVFALSAVAASGASAAKPEWKYSSQTFTSESKKAELKIPAIPATVYCKTSTDSGSILSKTTGEVTVTFEDCYLGAATNPCGNDPGAASGTIITNPLSMTLGYIKKNTKEVGVSLAPASGSYLAQFECDVAGTPYTIRVTGSVIGKITPVNTLTNEFELEFTESGGKQVPTKFAGGAEDTLTSEVSINGGAYSSYAATEVLEPWKQKVGETEVNRIGDLVTLSASNEIEA